MTSAKLNFEQVPVAVAKQVAEMEARAFLASPVACAICGAPVKLEHCKVDGGGDAVHEACYVGKLSSPLSSMLPQSNPFA